MHSNRNLTTNWTKRTINWTTSLPLVMREGRDEKEDKGGQKEKVILGSDSKFHNEERGGQKEKIVMHRKKFPIP